jgi:hypothetical protein
MKRFAGLLKRKMPSCLLMTVVLLTASSQACGVNLLVNGGFESGNIGFASEYVYQDWLFDAAAYCVGSNPHDHHADFLDLAAQEGLLMMIVNGAEQPGIRVWRESQIPVSPGTTYYFSTWAACVNHDLGPQATLLFSINGSPLGTLTTTFGGSWNEFYATWNSGSDTSADVTVVDLNTEYGGNDFAIDNMALDDVAPTATGKTTWGQIKGLYR